MTEEKNVKMHPDLRVFVDNRNLDLFQKREKKSRGFNIKWKGQKRALELELDSKNPNSFQLSSKRADLVLSDPPSKHVHWQRGESLKGGGGILREIEGR